MSAPDEVVPSSEVEVLPAPKLKAKRKATLHVNVDPETEAIMKAWVDESNCSLTALLERLIQRSQTLTDEERAEIEHEAHRLDARRRSRKPFGVVEAAAPTPPAEGTTAEPVTAKS